MEKAIKKYIQSIFIDYTYKAMKLGASGGKVYELVSPEGTTFVLKIVYVKNEYDSQVDEVSFYKWLDGKVKVAKIVYFEQRLDLIDIPVEILVMEKLEGENLETLLEKHDKKIVVEAYGDFLRNLHLLAHDNCPIKVSLDKKIKQAKNLMDRGFVDQTSFESAYKDMPTSILFERILKDKPSDEDLVIGHGDYCLDNIIGNYKDSKIELSGLIDLGRGGLQDRYQDLGLALRTISGDFGDEYIKDFLKAYGLIENLDQKKIDYYILMDEFF